VEHLIGGAQSAGGVAAGRGLAARVKPAALEAWAIMEMNVFACLRYAVWGDKDSDKPRTADEVAGAVNDLLARGILKG
jgi:hypothetical protein